MFHTNTQSSFFKQFPLAIQLIISNMSYPTMNVQA